MAKDKTEEPFKKLANLGKVIREEIAASKSLAEKELGEIRAAIGVEKVNYQRHKEKDNPELFKHKKHEL